MHFKCLYSLRSDCKSARTEKLGDAVDTISGKVDTINEHIDQVMEDAPTKLKVTVTLCDTDWQKIQDLFDQEHKWMLGKMQEHIREVNGITFKSFIVIIVSVFTKCACKGTKVMRETLIFGHNDDKMDIIESR